MNLGVALTTSAYLSTAATYITLLLLLKKMRKKNIPKITSDKTFNILFMASSFLLLLRIGLLLLCVTNRKLTIFFSLKTGNDIYSLAKCAFLLNHFFF